MNNAKVIIPDVQATNGVIHVIDTVLLPPAAKQNIVKTAVAAGQFKTLASLVTKAGLVGDALRRTGTVFAPDRRGVREGAEGDARGARQEPCPAQRVLLYHVVKGECPASKVVTLNGKSVQDAGSRVGEDQGLRRQRLPERLDQGYEDRRDGLERRHPRHQQGADPLLVELVATSLRRCDQTDGPRITAARRLSTQLRL